MAAGSTLALAHVLTAAAAVPLTALSVVLAWRLQSFPRALVTVLGGAAAIGFLATVVVGAVAGLGQGLAALGAFVAVAIGVVAIPLAAGRALVRRSTRTPPAVALRWATLGWPVAAVASTGITLLEGAAFVVAAPFALAVLWGGPGVLGVWLARRFGRDRAPSGVAATGGRPGVPPADGGSEDRD